MVLCCFFFPMDLVLKRDASSFSPMEFMDLGKHVQIMMEFVEEKQVCCLKVEIVEIRF